MKNSLPRFIPGRLTRNLFLFSLFIIGLIYSCKKDLNTTETPSFDNAAQTAAVKEAKAWFETNAKINKQSTKTTNSLADRKWNDGVNLDWNKPDVYSKRKGAFVELPLVNSSVVFAFDRSNVNGITQKNNYTKTSFIVQKDSTGVFRGWYMVLIADTAYVNGNFDKLSLNTYKSNDKNFSGRLLYYTTEGYFLAGWRYEKGVIIKTLSVNAQSSAVTPQKLQINSNTKVNSEAICNTHSVVTTTASCFTDPNTGMYDCTYTSTTATVTECYTPPGGGGGGGGEGGSGGSGGGSGEFPPPPDPVPCPTVNTTSNKTVNGTTKVNIVNPNPPGGSTDPGDGPTQPNPDPQPCVIVWTIRTDSLYKNFPCAVKLILNKLAAISDYNKFIQPFSTVKKPDLNWSSAPLSWNTSDPLIPGSTSTYKLGQTQPNDRSANIILNSKMLQNSSQLMIAAAVIHETIHAYVNYNIVTYTGGFQTPANYSSEKPWLYALDVWSIQSGIPPNYRDHNEMLTNYFDQAVSALKTWDNNATRNDKDYAMAMLYGLNTGDFAVMQSSLAQAYTTIMGKYKITDTDLQNFWRAQLNATTGKLPTSGC